MLSKQFGNTLYYNQVGEGESAKLRKIKYTYYPSNHKNLVTSDPNLATEIDAEVDVESCFRIKKIVGYGATSVVYKASYDPETDKSIKADKGEKEKVAIKKIKNVFESDVYAHRVLRELRLLRLLQGHNNVSRFIKTFLRSLIFEI